ncbi:hypothetical protein CLF_105264 [Clonorchis sinensis]|nr:hypothetical protein CLF_105264 [Clonorchis sinensis]
MFDTPTTGVDTVVTNKMGQLNIGPKDSKPKEPIVPQGPPQDLLSAIRAGLTLRKVTDRPISKANGEKFTRNMSVLSLGNKPNDVQAIYEAVRRRRECMENNSTDDENTESSDWDD